MCVCVCALNALVVVRTNSCKTVVLRGAISYFLTTRSTQMNVKAAIDVDAKYKLNPRSIVSVLVRVGRRCVGVYFNICMVAR